VLEKPRNSTAKTVQKQFEKQNTLHQSTDPLVFCIFLGFVTKHHIIGASPSPALQPPPPPPPPPPRPNAITLSLSDSQ
jgi:hypothetical protein